MAFVTDVIGLFGSAVQAVASVNVLMIFAIVIIMGAVASLWLYLAFTARR